MTRAKFLLSALAAAVFGIPDPGTRRRRSHRHKIAPVLEIDTAASAVEVRNGPR